MRQAKHKIILYNPRAVFYTMPLGLLAIGSRLDSAHYDVKIIDARLERDPHGAVLTELDDALCLGVSVLTGAPIRDALLLTCAVQAKRPDLPIVWGGWHPSLFPRECVAEASVAAAVEGQGEDTLTEIVMRLANGAMPEGVSGCTHRADGEIKTEAPNLRFFFFDRLAPCAWRARDRGWWYRNVQFRVERDRWSCDSVL